MTPLKRVGIYVRVSTGHQDASMQLRELTDFANARGWRIYKVYEDIATGTSAVKRPMLASLMEDAKQRRIDVIACWKLDRFFRSLKDLVNTLSELNDLGVEFVSLKDNMDMTTNVGKLLTHLLGAFAEFEASIIRMRVKAGLANAKAKGKRLGRPTRIDRNQIARLREQGLSLSQIAKRLGTSKGAVSKTLSKLRAQGAETSRTAPNTNHGRSNTSLVNPKKEGGDE